MSRSRVEKYATTAATRAAPASPAAVASARLGGWSRSSAMAVPYIPTPKKAEWPKETMPV